MPRTITVELNLRALRARLNRALAKQGHELRTIRRGGDMSFVLIDSRRRAIAEANVNIEALARKMGSLEPWERLAKE